MQSYTAFTACNSACSRQISSPQRSNPHRQLSHTASKARLGRRVTRAYLIESYAGVSQDRLGISHSLHDILRPSINLVQVKRQAPTNAEGLSALVQECPSFESKVSSACDHKHNKERCSSARTAAALGAAGHQQSYGGHAGHLHESAGVCL